MPGCETRSRTRGVRTRGRPLPARANVAPLRGLYRCSEIYPFGERGRENAARIAAEPRELLRGIHQDVHGEFAGQHLEERARPLDEWQRGRPDHDDVEIAALVRVTPCGRAEEDRAFASEPPQGVPSKGPATPCRAAAPVGERRPTRTNTWCSHTSRHHGADSPSLARRVLPDRLLELPDVLRRRSGRRCFWQG